jgi:predicted amidohydrolase YtcJ
MAKTTIFRAKKIVTMNPSNPEATHVAVRDGRILGAGSLEDLTGWGEYDLDDTFQDKVLVPGFVEAHAHVLEGVCAQFPYVGYFDRRAVDGTVNAGLNSRPALIARLKELDAGLADPTAPLVAWGFDPIYFPGERLSARDLDQVSTTRPIFLIHASLHIATVNTAMLRLSGITRDTEAEGVVKGADGEPLGELQEMPAMALASAGLMAVLDAMGSEQAIWDFGASARNVGVTTVADLAGEALTQPKLQATWQKIVNDAAFPARVAQYNIPALPGATADYGQVAASLDELRKSSTPKLRFPGVKLVVDGSIQGFTAVMKEWPGYFNGAPNGLWQIPPEQINAAVLAFHQRGINVHAHCNGDESIEAFVDAVDQCLRQVSWLDHRHTVQHCQLTSAAQYRRMAKLGMCANIFANQLWYWGDQHYELTVGPERANRMEACATARREGLHFALHSDAPVTPLGPLHLMWCAVNRVTPKGRVLGEYEKISAHDALFAVTVDAAYQMHLDAEIGSIECGKWADFTVLDASPLDVAPMAIKDIPVWGTVVGGVKYEAAKGQAGGAPASRK